VVVQLSTSKDLHSPHMLSSIPQEKARLMSITPIINITQIASWWLPKQLEKELTDSEIRAVLPPVQRGFVWKTGQVEYLWDSIVRGFPIGSLLLAERNHNTEIREGQGSDGKCENPTHDLLDGQQRATAIAIGFRDIWFSDINNERNVIETLWVDLIPLADNERRFSFHMVTKSHPWGYSKKKPNKRISNADASAALKVFRVINGNGNGIKPCDLKINEVFPWDSKAPIPVPLLIKAIMKFPYGNNDEIIEELIILLDATQLWQALCKGSGADLTKLQEVKIILNATTDGNEGINELIDGLKFSLTSLEVPAPICLHQNVSEYDVKSDDDNHDPIFTLFKRINTGGTMLSREEINYSLLKSVWPDAHIVIEKKLLEKRQIAQPARMVSLMSRLAIMTDHTKPKSGIQAELSIAQFRKFLREDKAKDKEKRFETFCEQEGEWIIEKVWQLLTESKYALPKVLAAQISRNGSDLMLLIMYWTYRMGDQWENLQEEQRKRTLGFITAVHWFSPDIVRCVKRLTKELSEIQEDASLIDFFNNKRFSDILKVDEQQRVLMTPLPSPEAVKEVLMQKIPENDGYIKIPKNIKESELWWKKKGIWDHFGGVNSPEDMINFFNQYTKDNDQKSREVWFNFFKFIFNDRRLLLYAQRCKINDWFDWYDPTLPDQIHDHNRPWDNDHILPHSWAHDKRGVYQNFPYLVRIWINANGNFRIWPLELNRSKGNKVIIEESIESYNLHDKSMVYEASFINKKNQVEWEKLDNEELWEKDTSGNYDNKFWKQGNHWGIFLDAAMDRTIDIYREWYEQLAIDQLMQY
jgi:Protein of unknown function DUF262